MLKPAVSEGEHRSKVKPLRLALRNNANKGSGATFCSILNLHTFTPSVYALHHRIYRKQTTVYDHSSVLQPEVVRKVSSCEMKWNNRPTRWWDIIQEDSSSLMMCWVCGISTRRGKKKGRVLSSKCLSPVPNAWRVLSHQLILTSALNNNSKELLNGHISNRGDVTHHNITALTSERVENILISVLRGC